MDSGSSNPENWEYWKNRSFTDTRMDWRNGGTSWIEEYDKSVDHPHRQYIIDSLKKNQFSSLLEIGCNAGANLVKIKQAFPLVRLKGIDINKDAIEFAKQKYPDISFEVKNLNELKLPYHSWDVILLDAVLLYIDNQEFSKVWTELTHATRKAIILFEWNSDSLLGEIKDHHWSRDYDSLLRLALFEKRICSPITKNMWPNERWQKNGLFCVAVRRS